MIFIVAAVPLKNAKWLYVDGATGEPQGFSPKRRGAVHQLHHRGDCVDERVDLLVTYYQGRRHFQNHEAVAADLGENTVVAIHPHDYYLPKHAAVNVHERFKRHAEAHLLGSLKFNPREHAHAADLAHHFVIR